MDESVVVPDGFEVVACPRCGGGKYAIAHRGADRILGQPIVLQVVRCDGCGLHYTNPRPRIERLGDYYPSAYAPHQRKTEAVDDDRDGEGWLRTAVLGAAYGSPAHQPRGAVRAAARVVTFIKPAKSFGFGVPFHGQGRLLDFGCGAGKFLRRMHRLGWNVTGIDFSDAAVASVRKSGLNALQGTLPHVELSPATFDVITMRHSLEHVPDPLAVLRAAKTLLVTGGRLLVQVPNFASWEVDHFGDASPRIDLPRHLTHFTPKTLRDMLGGAGFRVTSVKQICRSNWLRKAANVPTNGHPRRLFDRVLGASSMCCRATAFACELRGRGNEIIATAENG